MQRQSRLVHAEITPGKVGGQVAAQALRVELDAIHRAEMHHIAATRKGTVNDTSAAGATRDSKGVVGVRRCWDAVAAEACDGVEDGRGRPLVGRGVQSPVPIRLRAGIVALGAEHGLVHGNHVPVPREEVASVVDGEGLLDVGVNKIIVS